MNAGIKAWTRRRFLEAVGRAGGASAVYRTMTALELIPSPDGWAGPATLPQSSGRNKTVLILGAGIAGLAAAYELTRAGFQCHVLEAQPQAGGRNFTARRGTGIAEESAEHGATRQTCGFDDGLYVNLGPGRIPYHHRRMLHYCAELNVPLEIYVIQTTANLFHMKDSFGGRPQVRRRIGNDADAYIGELLSKAVSQGGLDQELDTADKEKLLALLTVFGDLQAGKPCPEGTHCPPRNSICEDPQGIGDICDPKTRLPFKELLHSQFWQHRFYNEDNYDYQPTLFQPIGGMDKIIEGFLRKTGHLVEFNCAATNIRLLDDGVEVVYRKQGRESMKRADYCVSSIPLPVLQRIPANFSPEFKAAVDQGRFTPVCKVGWQANQRFWESDKYQIFGGVSFTDEITREIWYPSHGYFQKSGALVGAYTSGNDALEFGKMSCEQRLSVARAIGARLHPEFADDRIVPPRLGVSIAWQNIPTQLGGFPGLGQDRAEARKAYLRLLQPDGRFHIIGDQVSPLTAWQEGALMSVEHVMAQISRKSV
ncbi:MAG TPA: FAD-dependent oxidoreductase [Candidatus Saccharimonadales bacterium]|jgi:monoamine oxidase|nr:FAD-dependent oxidoreductase [Candidatus Saccharimonadales bacterium]